MARTAVPPNDVCSGAQVIPATAGAISPYLTPITDILDATDAGDPNTENTCQTNVQHGVWYVFTPQKEAFYTLSTLPQDTPGTTVDDTVLAIFTSVGDCAGPFVEIPSTEFSVGCNDDFDPLGQEYHAALTTLLNAGTTYYILAWHYFDVDDPFPLGPGASTIQLRITRTIPPHNDDCSQAEVVTLNLPVIGTTFRATNDYQLNNPACYGGVGQIFSEAPGPDVVYSFTAPVADTYSFKVFGANLQNDFVLYLMTNCPAGNPPVVLTNCLQAANRVPGSPEELACVFLVAQQQVYLVVDETNSLSSGGNFSLEVTKCFPETETNNTPATATLFVCGMEGSIDPRSDVDFYALGTYPRGSRLFAMVDGNAANNTRDFDLRVTSMTETIEYDEGDNSVEFGAFSPNVCGVPLPREPVFLSVNYNRSTFAAEPYRVYAVAQPSWIKAISEVEPNDSLLEANSAAQNYFRGTLDGPAPSTDVDTFSFAAKAEDLVFVALDGNPQRTNAPINAQLELLDEPGNVLIAVNDGGPNTATFSSTNTTPGSLTASSPYSPGEALVYRVLQDGLYHVRVSIGTTNETVGAGDYLLSISFNCQGSIETNNHPPTITSLLAPAQVNEGESFDVSGTLQDSDTLDTHSVVIDWGDGVETNELGSGVVSFQIPHQYLDDDPNLTSSDTHAVSILLVDEAGATAGTNVAITVANVAPTIKSLDLSSTVIAENETVTLNGQFRDPGLGDIHSLTIDWGDGNASHPTLEIGQRTFSVMHQYLDDNPSVTPSDHYFIGVTIADDDGGSDTDTAELTVQNVPPQLTGVEISSPISPYQTAVLRGTISDPSPRDTFSLVVDWGDGSVRQTNAYPAGSGAFAVSHKYVLADTILPVALILVDDDAGSATANTTITMNPAPANLQVLSINHLPNGRVQLTLRGAPQETYHLLFSTNLLNWEPLLGGPYTADEKGVIRVEDAESDQMLKRFYRSVQP